METPSIDKNSPDTQMRKLVAIMFADMTGFTAMMQEDEAKAKILREQAAANIRNSYSFI